jgi:hypothetical protein
MAGFCRKEFAAIIRIQDTGSFLMGVVRAWSTNHGKVRAEITGVCDAR